MLVANLGRFVRTMYLTKSGIGFCTRRHQKAGKYQWETREEADYEQRAVDSI